MKQAPITPEQTTPANTLPELEQLADWLIRQELPPPELPKASSPAPSPEVLSPDPANPEDQPEAYYDRRSEVKDTPASAPANLNPMVPIGQVLKSRQAPLAPTTPSATPKTTPKSNRHITTLTPLTTLHPYKKPIILGFLSGIALCTAIVLGTVL